MLTAWYAIGMKRGDTDLLQWVNTFVFFHLQNGDLGHLRSGWVGRCRRRRCSRRCDVQRNRSHQDLGDCLRRSQADPASEQRCARFRRRSSATTCAALVGTANLRPLHRERTDGRHGAVTVRVRPGDNLVLHRALDHCRPGDVVVVEAAGISGQAVTGKIMARYLECIGAARSCRRRLDSRSRRDRQRGISLLCARRHLRGPTRAARARSTCRSSIDGMVVRRATLWLATADGLVAFPTRGCAATDRKTQGAAAEGGGGLQAIAPGPLGPLVDRRRRGEAGLP